MTFWTPEREEQYKRLYAEGLSHSIIAERMGGGLSRNASIGKAHRLGLPGRVHNQGFKGQRKVRARQRAGIIRNPFGFMHPAPKRTAAEEREAREIRASIADPAYADCLPFEKLRDDTCRWPIGDPPRFCGRKTCQHGGGTYCEAHDARAYQPGTGYRQRWKSADQRIAFVCKQRRAWALRKAQEAPQ